MRINIIQITCSNIPAEAGASAERGSKNYKNIILFEQHYIDHILINIKPQPVAK